MPTAGSTCRRPCAPRRRAASPASSAKADPSCAEVLVARDLLDEVVACDESSSRSGEPGVPALGPGLRAALVTRFRLSGGGARRRRPARALREELLMFTGIVTDVGRVAAVARARGRCAASASNPPTIPATIALGASIACSRPVPDRRSRPAGAPERMLVRGRCGRRDPRPHHGRAMAGRAPA